MPGMLRKPGKGWHGRRREKGSGAERGNRTACEGPVGYWKDFAVFPEGGGNHRCFGTKREVTRFRCSPAPPGGHGGWDRLGSKNKIRANETTWVQVNRMGGGCRGRQWKILVLTRMCSYIPGRNFDKTQVFYRETKPHNNCSLGQLLTDCPTEAVPMSCSRDKPGCELWAMLEMQLLAHLFFSPPLNKVFF